MQVGKIALPTLPRGPAKRWDGLGVLNFGFSAPRALPLPLPLGLNLPGREALDILIGASLAVLVPYCFALLSNFVFH